MLAGYLGVSERFDEAITKFAIEYADQTDRDWQALAHSHRTAAPARKATVATPATRAGKPAKRSPRKPKKSRHNTK
jgi:hypothetical protein